MKLAGMIMAIEELIAQLGRKEQSRLVIGSWLDYGLTYSKYDGRTSNMMLHVRVVHPILV